MFLKAVYVCCIRSVIHQTIENRQIDIQLSAHQLRIIAKALTREEGNEKEWGRCLGQQ